MALTVATRRFFYFVPALILTMFATSWAAMIALTFWPSSELLWMANLTVARLFRETIYAIHDFGGVGVLTAALVFGLIAVVSGLAATRRAAPVRFVTAHLSLLVLALPVMNTAVTAAASPEAAFLTLTNGVLNVSMWDVSAARLGLVGAAAFACVFAHLEMIRRWHRRRTVQDRARRLLMAG